METKTPARADTGSEKLAYNKSGMAVIISQRTGINIGVVEDILDALTAVSREILTRGGQISIRNLGTIKLKIWRTARLEAETGEKSIQTRYSAVMKFSSKFLDEKEITKWMEMKKVR